jgi:hypothetical protein
MQGFGIAQFRSVAKKRVQSADEAPVRLSLLKNPYFGIVLKGHDLRRC